MPKRTERYQKNIADELFLKKFNISLFDLEKEYAVSQKQSSQPVLFICGAPRSGTTLITQVLARTDVFNYVDNFVARFWRAPFVGFYLEKLIGLRQMLRKIGYSFTSEFGRTHGILDPHEFVYFWEYWLQPTSRHHIIPVHHLERIDVHGLRNEINAMLNSYNKPLFFKSVWFLSNPLLAYKLFSSVYIIFITRDLLTNALSILDARKEYHGDKNEWFSVRPTNFARLKKYPVERQITEQIKRINNEILEQTKDFPERIINITYEELCNNPLKTILKIADHIGIKNIDIKTIRKRIPQRFALHKSMASKETVKRFEKAL
jgi:LPS sulfotransferase NodH